MWDGTMDHDEPVDDVDAFYPGEAHRSIPKEPIPRLGPDDILELRETMFRMNPHYHPAETLINEEKLERAVRDRLNRLRKANKFNGVISFGPVETVPAVLNIGNVKIPTLICVTGHSGAGGNIKVNGIYERYPDNYHGRPVFQKYLERDNWVAQPQEVEFRNGGRAYASAHPGGGRTFPVVYDEPATKLAMKHTMVSCKILPAKKKPGPGHFRFVDKIESWFLFFDSLLGAWCIGDKPGSSAVFARCFGVDIAIPDNLGPNTWQVFDCGHRVWYMHSQLRTLKGGVVSSAICA